MDKLVSVLQVVIPIFAAIGLGAFAKKKDLMSQEQIQGFQNFVMKFGLPCTLFNSCFRAELGAEAVSSMALLLPLLLCSSLWAFRARKTRFVYHNLPMLFSAQESGMLGIPLFITLFGAGQAYRMGVLDLAQSSIAIPVIAILSTQAGENPKISQIVRQVFRSPLLLMSLLGLVLNLSGAAKLLDGIGIGPIITETTGFLAQPVSAIMLFSVGYNFSLRKGSRAKVFRLAAIHFLFFLVIGLLMQAIMLALPSVEPETRWAILLYSTLPSSYLSASLGRTGEEASLGSSVCSVLTLMSLAVFCVIAAIVA